MFPQQRQLKLDPLLDKLRKLPGIKEIHQDDFDSSAINVVLVLDDMGSRAGSFDGQRPYRFAVSIRKVKGAIIRVLKEVGFNFLDWPELRYISNGGEKVKNGYSGDSIKIEVFV